ncbi:hypothetical protein QZH41_016727, partial [Actinostola sp. cb2023]
MTNSSVIFIFTTQATYSPHTCHSIRRLVQTDVVTDAERKLAETLASKIDATVIRVRDISGGCGAMYEISVESEVFRGKRKVQQHRIVNE